MSKVAYGAYTVAIDVKPAGVVGVAEFNGSKITVPKSPAALERTDPKVFYFKNLDGENRVLVFETKYDVNSNPTGGRISVYDENLNQIVAPDETSKLVNLYAITDSVDLGDQYDYIYGIDYDLHKIVRIKICAGSTLEIGTEYSSFAPTDGAGYGVDVLTDGTSVYGLFVSAKNILRGDYDSYSLIRLDKNLDNPVRLDVSEKNPFSISLYNGDLYVTLVGGPQNSGSTNGSASKIQKVPAAFTETTAPATLLVGGATSELGDFRALSFTAAGEAYILTGRLDSDGENFSGTLYCITAEAMNAAAGGTIASLNIAKNSRVNFKNVAGWTWGIFYSESDGVLWTAQGEDIGVYTANVKKDPFGINKTITISELAGSKYHLNSVALLTAGAKLKAYTAPEFASVSKAARLFREKLLSE